MTCPHCGAAAKSTDRFCPKCSRLVDSPLLKIKQELDAARASYAAHAVTSGARQAPASATAAAPTSRASGSPPPVPKPKRPRAPKAPSVPQPKARPAAHVGHTGTTLDDQPVAPSLQQEVHSSAEVPSRAVPTAAIAVLVLANLAVIAGLYGALQALAGWPEGTLGHEIYPLFRMGAYAIGGLAAFAGFGLFTLRPFGRSLQRLLAVLWLPVFPFGTLLGLFMWVYLGRPGVRALFGQSSVPPTPEQRKVAASSRKLAPLAAVALLVLHVLAGITVIAVAFASAPTLSETRTLEDVMREAAGTSDAGQLSAADIVLEMHRYASAQADYASANSGLYDRTECLVEGALCIPDHASRDGVLPASYLQVNRRGYDFRLHMGAPPEERPAGASATSVSEYAYVASPVHQGGMAYCIGSADRLCVFAPDETAAVEGGRCPRACLPLDP